MEAVVAVPEPTLTLHQPSKFITVNATGVAPPQPLAPAAPPDAPALPPDSPPAPPD
jgi:hypothetical protein